MYYKPVKVIISKLGLAKVIFNIIIKYYGILDSIVSNQGLVFTSNFVSFLY